MKFFFFEFFVSIFFLKFNFFEKVKHLYDLNILTEQQYSMGVSALPYEDAMELLRNDFPAKYDLFVREKMKAHLGSLLKVKFQKTFIF